jgi:hypothetical protein
MNRSLIIMLSVWLYPLLVSAESETGLALKGGLDAATLNKEYRVNRYGSTGGVAGYLQWPLADRFSLAGQIELLYTPRGAEVIFEGVPQGKIRQHYLDVMVAARPAVRLGPASIYLLLGGGLNVLVSANDENAAGVPRDVTDDLHRIDMTLLAGAGLALHLPRRGLGPFRLGTVFLEARHDRGLIDIDTQDLGFKNRSSSLLLGLSFALSGERAAAPAASSARSDSPAPAAAAVSAR